MRAFVVDEPRVRALRALNYAPAVERIRRAGSSSALPLHEIVKAFGPAYGTVFTRLDCSPEHGVELITQGDMFAAEPSGRVIRLDSMRNPERHLVTRGQVLIAGAGTLGENELYGRSILADGRLVGKYVGPHSMSLHFDDPEDDFSLFAYAWLASPTGIQALRSTSYGTKILGLRKDVLRTLPVPLPETATIARVASLIRECTQAREKSLENIRAARALVEADPDIQEASSMCEHRSRRTALWSGPFPTLAAWTFASTGGALGMLRQRWAARIADVILPDGLYRGGRYARVSCSSPYGVDFMSQRDAFLVRPAPQRVLLASPALIPRPGTILIGAQGNIGEGDLFGRAVLVAPSDRGAAYTEHLLRVEPKDGFGERLFGFLSSFIGFRLVRSTAVGTAQRSIRTDLLAGLPIPDLQTRGFGIVEKHVRASLTARAHAHAAECEAIRIIEEEVLPQWLA